MAAAITPESQQSLAIGDPVQVIADTYSAIRVHTVARVARVRQYKDQPPLYELDSWPEFPFWRWELRKVK